MSVLRGAGMLGLPGRNMSIELLRLWSEFLVHVSKRALGEPSCLNDCRH